jgi:hypothetical protein
MPGRQVSGDGRLARTAAASDPVDVPEPFAHLISEAIERERPGFQRAMERLRNAGDALAIGEGSTRRSRNR